MTCTSSGFLTCPGGCQCSPATLRPAPLQLLLGWWEGHAPSHGPPVWRKEIFKSSPIKENAFLQTKAFKSGHKKYLFVWGMSFDILNVKGWDSFVYQCRVCDLPQLFPDVRPGFLAYLLQFCRPDKVTFFITFYESTAGHICHFVKCKNDTHSWWLKLWTGILKTAPWNRRSRWRSWTTINT